MVATLTKRQRQGDLTCLASCWEGIVETVEYPTRRFAVRVLYEVTEAYLRGQGIRLGNPQSREPHVLNVAALLADVVKRVVNDDARDIWFPALEKVGFSGEEEAREVLGQVSFRDYQGHE